MLCFVFVLPVPLMDRGVPRIFSESYVSQVLFMLLVLSVIDDEVMVSEVGVGGKGGVLLLQIADAEGDDV